MDVVDLRRRQAEIESRIYRTQDRLRAELSRLRGRADHRRQSVREARKTAVQVLIGAGVGIVLSLLTSVFRNAARSARERAFEASRGREGGLELEEREGYGRGARSGDSLGDRASRRMHPGEVPYPRHEERYARDDRYLGGHREPIPPGYGRRLTPEDDHDWAKLPLRGRRPKR